MSLQLTVAPQSLEPAIVRVLLLQAGDEEADAETERPVLSESKLQALLKEASPLLPVISEPFLLQPHACT